MTALISKPGITSASTLSIPTDWSQTWMQGLVSNLLQGGDVRNAIGVGCTITGNISTPYATITVGGGFTNPITGPVLINAPGTDAATGGANRALVLRGRPNSYTEEVEGSATVGQSYGLVIQAGTNSSDVSFLVLSQPGTAYMEVRGDGKILGLGPVAAALVDMTPDIGTFTGTFTGFNAASTGTCTWARVGNLCFLGIPPPSVQVSNATTFTMTGLPAAIRPASSITFFVPDMQDAGAAIQCVGNVSAGGSVINFSPSFGVTGSWTASGNKGVRNSGFAICSYPLN